MMLSKNAAPGLRGLELVAVIGAWLVGIVLESWLPLPGFALLCGACSALVFIILLWRDKQGRLVMLIILWLLLTAHSSPGVFASMVFPGITVNSSGGNPIIAALYHLRTVLATLISQSLPQPEAALLIAILLGLREPGLQLVVSFFNETGTAHLIAPSGFKVTILAGLVIASTRWLYAKPGARTTNLLPAQKYRGKGRWLATALVVCSIAAYTVLNGAGPAALRAGIMGILLVAAPRLGRIYNIYTALAASAFLMSIFDPFVLWDAGFELSFLGTLGIVMLTPFLQRLFRPIERLPFGHFVGEVSAVTLAAQIATLPIFALTFNQAETIVKMVKEVQDSDRASLATKAADKD